MMEKMQLLCIFMGLFISDVSTRTPQKIVKGSSTSFTELLHQASIQSRGYHFCGGTIIAPEFILSAAHCFVDSEYLESNKGELKVLVGTHDKLGITSGTFIDVERLVIHAKYNWADSARHDIAILKLTNRIVYNEVQKAARLPSKPTPPHTIVISSGWGAKNYDFINREVLELPQYLQKMESPVLEQDDCQQRFPNEHILPEHICTLSTSGSAPCDGDSGGPVTLGDEVVAVISWGIGCSEGYPEVGLRVYNYVSWIYDAMSALNTLDPGLVRTSSIREISTSHPFVIIT